jgi:serine/threonine-protein phosphatase 2A regulatory subunit B
VKRKLASTMEKEGDPSGGWRFAQCFGDKGEVEEITEGG